jgi:hypothetical protein
VHGWTERGRLTAKLNLDPSVCDHYLAWLRARQLAAGMRAKPPIVSAWIVSAFKKHLKRKTDVDVFGLMRARTDRGLKQGRSSRSTRKPTRTPS